MALFEARKSSKAAALDLQESERASALAEASASEAALIAFNCSAAETAAAEKAMDARAAAQHAQHALTAGKSFFSKVTAATFKAKPGAAEPPAPSMAQVAADAAVAAAEEAHRTAEAQSLEATAAARTSAG